MPNILVFASGGKDGGGSGFQELVENTKTGVLRARIVAVVSNHADGGVTRRAIRLGIPFVHFSRQWDADGYRRLASLHSVDFVVLSGWLKLVSGLDPRKTINIHPGPLPRFGGRGMYGHHVHEAVMAAYQDGTVSASEVCMHFVTPEYDRGPVFFRYPVRIRPDDTAESLAARVNKIEHGWQSFITNLVVHGQIRWDGVNPESLVVPEGYGFLG